MTRALTLACILLVRLHAQIFDVASVRPHDPASETFLVRMPTAGHFTAEGAPLKLLIMLAWGVQESQIAGGPDWLSNQKWDITAKCDDERHSHDETNVMLQHLLEERFSLQIHRESQQRPVYLLALAKGGPKFKPSEKKATKRRNRARPTRPWARSMVRSSPHCRNSWGYGWSRRGLLLTCSWWMALNGREGIDPQCPR